MRLEYTLAVQVHGTLDEIIAPTDAVVAAVAETPGLDDVLTSLRDLAFIVETVAHLQGRESTILPAAERARELCKLLTDRDLPASTPVAADRARES